jgi:predicted RNase H-like HicB family nuclease
MVYKLPVTIKNVNKEYIAHCAAVRATATGDTPDEAVKNLEEAIDDMIKEFGPDMVFKDLNPDLDYRLIEVRQ